VPQPTSVPAPAPVPQPAPAPVQAPPAEPEVDYQEQAEQSAGIADTMKTIFWGFINWVAAPLLIVFILHNFVFQAYHVDGSSMTPTLHTADYMIVSKVENTFAKLTGKAYIPRRHQVVVFNYPQDPSLIFIKRVTALPGERVVVKNGTITIYNTEHPEGFSPDDDSFERSATYTEGDVDEVVPEGNIFVVGDNRLPSGSYDSREWGMLPSKDIIGNAVIRLLPLDGFRFFNYIPEVKLGLN
jgi:signal peptidase I